MPSPRLRQRATLAALALLPVLAACDDAPPRPPSPHTLRIGITQGVGRLDPYGDGYDDWLAAGLAFDGLLRVAPDGTLGPALAAEWTSPDAQHVRLRLRPGVRFADGTPLTAPAVIEAWTAGLASASGPELLGKGMAAIRGARDVVERRARTLDGVRAVDSLTLDVTLDAPHPAFLAAFGSRAFDVWRPGSPPIGTGPWRWLDGRREGMAVGDSLRYVRNPHYWGTRPAFDTLVLTMLPPASVAEQLTQRQIDCTLVLTHQQLRALSRNAAVVLPPDIPRNVARIVFNARSPKLRDVAVRQALLRAIDRAALARLFLGDRATPWRSALPQGARATPSQPFPSPDVAAARALLAGRGATPLAPLQIAMWGEAARDTGRTVAASIQAQLRDAGIAAMVTAPPAQFEQQGLGDIDLLIEVWIPPSNDAEGYLVENYHSTRSSPYANSGAVRDPALDAVIDALRMATDPAQRDRLIGTADSLLAAHAWMMPLWLEPTIAAHGRQVRGCRYDASRTQFLEVRPASR